MTWGIGTYIFINSFPGYRCWRWNDCVPFSERCRWHHGRDPISYAASIPADVKYNLSREKLHHRLSDTRGIHVQIISQVELRMKFWSEKIRWKTSRMCVLHQYINGSSFIERWLTSYTQTFAKNFSRQKGYYSCCSVCFDSNVFLPKKAGYKEWRNAKLVGNDRKGQIVKSYLRPFVAGLFLRPSFLAEDSFIAMNEVFFNNNWNVFIFSAFQCRKEAVYFLKIKIALCIGNPTATRSGNATYPYNFKPKENGRFYTKDALSVWTNLGKHLYFVWSVCVSSIKTDTRRIMRLDELFFEIRLERRTTRGSSSGRIMRLVPEMHNQTNYKMFARVRPDGSIRP